MEKCDPNVIEPGLPPEPTINRIRGRHQAALLDARGTTHGDYAEMSRSIQRIKDVMHHGTSWNNLTDGQKEALELIATKIGRIVCGDPQHRDHWADLSGYATKGLESCSEG